eukprot:GSA25T00017435001.1
MVLAVQVFIDPETGERHEQIVESPSKPKFQVSQQGEANDRGESSSLIGAGRSVDDRAARKKQVTIAVEEDPVRDGRNDRRATAEEKQKAQKARMHDLRKRAAQKFVARQRSPKKHEKMDLISRKNHLHIHGFEFDGEHAVSKERRQRRMNAARAQQFSRDPSPEVHGSDRVVDRMRSPKRYDGKVREVDLMGRSRNYKILERDLTEDDHAAMAETERRKARNQAQAAKMVRDQRARDARRGITHKYGKDRLSVAKPKVPGYIVARSRSPSPGSVDRIAAGVEAAGEKRDRGASKRLKEIQDKTRQSIEEKKKKDADEAAEKGALLAV